MDEAPGRAVVVDRTGGERTGSDDGTNPPRVVTMDVAGRKETAGVGTKEGAMVVLAIVAVVLAASVAAALVVVVATASGPGAAAISTVEQPNAG